ncbi:MAG: TonB-dependent receptor [Porticoccaceae bacterium]|nr:TonB-dependent receptor [Porticoccaceae bacterium]
MKLRHRITPSKTTLLSLLATATLTVGNVYADILEEVVVTAQKREQNMQDVGIAITAFSGDQLTQLGISNPDEMDLHVPGLMVTDGGNSFFTVMTLRGSTQLDFADHHEGPVAVYVDGAYQSFLAGTGMAFYDLDRSEVLKGPQGTLFGRNATGGLIHLITKKPSHETDAFVEVNVGEYGLIKTEAAIGGSLGENLSGRLSGLWNKTDGYINNLSNPGEKLVEVDSRNLRAQLLWESDEDTSLLLQARMSEDTDGNAAAYHAQPVALHFADMTYAQINAQSNGVTGAFGWPTDDTIHPGIGLKDGLHRIADPNSAEYEAFCLHPLSNGYFNAPGGVDCGGSMNDDDRYTAQVDQNGHFNRDYHGVTATFTKSFDNFEIVNILDYQSFKKNYLEDTDSTSLSTLVFYSYMDSWQFSEEFRIHWENDQSRWVAGAYFLHIDGDYTTGVALSDGQGWSTDNDYSVETDSYAFFLQGEYDINPNLTVTGGIRWTKDKKNAQFNPSCEWAIYGDPDCSDYLLPFFGFADDSAQILGYDLSRSEGEYAGKLQIDWKPNDDWLVYAGVTRGNKAGGYNAGSAGLYTIPDSEFDGEILTSYETGFKSTLSGGKTRLNATAFYYDYSDFQTFTQSGTAFLIFNIDAEVSGVEVELTTNPWEGWEFLLGASIQDAKVLDLNYGAGLQGDVDMTNAPDLSVNGLGRYSWSALNGGSMTAQVDFSYVGERQLNAIPSPAFMADDYMLVNARLSYTTGDGRLTTALWVKNLTDEEYSPTLFDLGTFTGSTVETMGQPRWFGASVRYHWN